MKPINVTVLVHLSYLILTSYKNKESKHIYLDLSDLAESLLLKKTIIPLLYKGQQVMNIDWFLLSITRRSLFGVQ